MKSLITTLSALLIIISVSAQSVPKTIRESDFTIGKTVVFKSKILGEDRQLNVYLPQNYIENTSKSYPVIYLLDGSIDEDIIHVSGIVQFGSFSWINRNPESIVVGISNVDRKRDFTFPTTVEQDIIDFPTSGHSTTFIQFIQDELKPYVNSEFRTSDTNTLIGQSLGGLLATEILLKKPDLFDQYVIVSPSLWWNDESLLKQDLPEIKSDKSIYIAVGKEGEIMERTARSLYKKLKLSSSYNKHLNFEYLDHYSHGDILHHAVYNALFILNN
tara:strand:- start:519 stop:1337 length:819 start_codon:yes stop_codon:yes gene_type:complete